jgi:hypothetical protein
MSDELLSALEGNNPVNLRELADREGRAYAKFSEAQLVGLTGSHGKTECAPAPQRPPFVTSTKRAVGKRPAMIWLTILIAALTVAILILTGVMVWKG